MNKNIMVTCLELNKKGYKFTAPVLRCKSNDELQVILNRLNCLKRTIEKFNVDSTAIDENFEKSIKALEEKQNLEKQDLEKQIEELKKQLDIVHQIEKDKLTAAHEENKQNLKNLELSISEEIKKMNSDFAIMNKQTEESILLEDEYEKLCN